MGLPHPSNVSGQNVIFFSLFRYIHFNIFALVRLAKELNVKKKSFALKLTWNQCYNLQIFGILSEWCCPSALCRNNFVLMLLFSFSSLVVLFRFVYWEILIFDFLERFCIEKEKDWLNGQRTREPKKHVMCNERERKREKT